MKVLAIQLKRIGDLILTTPALNALAASGARVSLLVDSGCASLLPAIANVDEKLVHRKQSWNRALWRRLRADGWDAVLDFTGNDRSAMMAWFSRARRRVTFDWVRARWWKRLIYREYVASPVRVAHTCDHYGDLAKPLGVTMPSEAQPSLVLDEAAAQSASSLAKQAGVLGHYVLLHPGTARPEKYWPSERWAEVAVNLRRLGHAVLVTSGPDAFEQQHAREIMLAAERGSSTDIKPMALLNPPDLLALAALVREADLVLSCDTSVVHLAAAFQRPQVSIFGPTNPFHWRPRHSQAAVLSAASPDRELSEFQPKMRGAPTANLPPATVLAASMRLLQASPSSSAGTT